MGKMYLGSKPFPYIVNRSYSTTIPDPQASSIGKTISTTSNKYRIFGVGTKSTQKATTYTSSNYYNSVKYSSTSSEFSKSSKYSRSTYSTYNKESATSSKYTRTTYSTSEKPTQTSSTYSRTLVTYSTYTSTSVKSTYDANISSQFPASVYGKTSSSYYSKQLTKATFSTFGGSQSVRNSFSVNGFSRTYTISMASGSAATMSASITASHPDGKSSSMTVSSSKTNRIVVTTYWNLGTNYTGMFSQSISVGLRGRNATCTSSSPEGNSNISASLSFLWGKALASSTFSGTNSYPITAGTMAWLLNTATYAGYGYTMTVEAKQTAGQSTMTRTTLEQGTNSSIYTTRNTLTYYAGGGSATFANTRSSSTYPTATARDSKSIASGTFASSGAYNTTYNTTFNTAKEFYRYASTVTKYSAPASVYVTYDTFVSSTAYNTTYNTASTSSQFSRFSSTTTQYTYTKTNTGSMTATKTYANASNSSGSTSYSNMITYNTYTY